VTTRTHLLRRRRVLAVAGASALAVAAVALALALRSGTKQPPLPFMPAILGGQPPGAVVLAAEDRDLALALAVKPLPPGLLLVATVLDRDGGGAEHRDVTFRVATRSGGPAATATGRPCTPGCYEATVPASAAPAQVAVSVSGEDAAPAPIRFALPAVWPPRPASALVRKAEATYRRLTTVVTHERLGSSPTDVIHTTYWAKRPDRLHLKIRGGTESVIIGGVRWDRQPGRSWIRSELTPLQTVRPFWTPQIEDAFLLGSAAVGGRQTWVVSFANPQTPAYFTAWIDKRTFRTLQLHMTAAAHFMVHRYGSFDRPLRIVPPA